MTDLARAVRLMDRGEELLRTLKELKGYVDAGYGNMDALPQSVQGVRLLGKVLGCLRRAEEVIAAVEGDRVPVAAAGNTDDGGKRRVAPTLRTWGITT